MYKDSGRVIQEKANVLYQVVCNFNSEKANLGPDEVATNDMGYIFENLVQRFSESYDEQAGAHFTSRDIIYLMPTDSFYNTGIATYVWLVTKSKPAARRGKVQLIDIPLTRTFYEYKSIEPAATIAKRIQQREKTLMAGLKELFGE